MFFFFFFFLCVVVKVIIIIINHIENQHNHILHAIQTKDMDMSSVHPCREKKKKIIITKHKYKSKLLKI